MLNDQKIGVGILTYNREAKCKRLLDLVLSNDIIDYVIVVKNREIEYNNYDFEHNSDSRYHYVNVKEDIGVGACKNVALINMLNEKCDHLFLLEDDINIKDQNVFSEYIQTAKAFKLGHLNFCASYDSITRTYLTPFVSTGSIKGKQLDLYRRLCGNFLYFTNAAIRIAGIIDLISYVNMLEHAEHSYRMSIHLQYTPFNAFADIHESTKFLEDTGTESTIHPKTPEEKELATKRAHFAMTSFIMTYGVEMKNIMRPTILQLQWWLDRHLKS